jgi:hypothetical protein
MAIFTRRKEVSNMARRDKPDVRISRIRLSDWISPPGSRTRLHPNSTQLNNAQPAVDRIPYLLGRSERELQLLMKQAATSPPITEPNQLLEALVTEERIRLNVVAKPYRCDLNASPAIKEQEVTIWWLLCVLGVLTVISFYILWVEVNGGQPLDSRYQLVRPATDAQRAIPTVHTRGDKGYLVAS